MNKGTVIVISEVAMVDGDSVAGGLGVVTLGQGMQVMDILIFAVYSEFTAGFESQRSR